MRLFKCLQPSLQSVWSSQLCLDEALRSFLDWPDLRDLEAYTFEQYLPVSFCQRF